MNIKKFFGRNDLVLKAINNFGWLLSDKLTKLLIGFFLNILIARYLGPESYGQLAYGLAFIAFFQAASNLGVDALVVRDLANKGNKGLILSSVIKLRGLSAVVCTVVAMLVAIKFYDDKSFLICVMSVSILFSAGDVIDLWFQSQSRSKVTIISKFISYCIIVVFKLGIIVACLDKIFLFVAIPLEYLISSTILCFAVMRHGGIKIPIKEFNWPYLKRILKESWPLALSGISIVIFMRSGAFFIERKIGYQDVGIYSIGVSLAEIVYFIPMILMTSFSPVLAKTKAMGEVEYKLLFHRLLFWMFWGSISVAVLYGSVGYILLPHLYGASYEYSKYIFLVQIATLIPVSIGCCQSLWIVNEGRSRVALYQTISGALISITLNYFLIDMLGVIGACVSTLIAQCIQSVFINYFFCKELFLLTVKSVFWK
ncbi:flippase [Aeromonas veronii]|uniref:flippase n=1 Tax=Aeromonas veronii TaxID=654 RepID=UPI001F39D321|nr:flippase [Aeromonas veronii]MCF5846479.1 flippase [Aeromonas veronii]